MDLYNKQDNGCWTWTGADDGVNPVFGDGRNGRLHVWRKEKGPVQDGMWVVNTCGDSLCVAPEHQKTRLPTMAEAAEWTKKKAAKVVDEVAARRAELDAQLPKTLADFEGYSTKSTPYRDGPTCWDWNLGYSKEGYPTLPGIGDDGRSLETNVAHKVMELDGRPRPPSASAHNAMVAMRVCKNKKCVNPLHLKWVTKAAMQAATGFSVWKTGNRNHGFHNNRSKWR